MSEAFEIPTFENAHPREAKHFPPTLSPYALDCILRSPGWQRYYPKAGEGWDSILEHMLSWWALEHKWLLQALWKLVDHDNSHFEEQGIASALLRHMDDLFDIQGFLEHLAGFPGYGTPRPRKDERTMVAAQDTPEPPVVPDHHVVPDHV